MALFSRAPRYLLNVKSLLKFVRLLCCLQPRLLRLLVDFGNDSGVVMVPVESALVPYSGGERVLVRIDVYTLQEYLLVIKKKTM